MSNMNKSGTTKYDASVARATGKTDDAGGDDISVTGPMSDSAKQMIKKFDPANLDAFLNEPGYEHAPQVHTMQLWEQVSGICEGNGPQAEFSRIDPVTKTMEQIKVDTWIISAPNGSQRISILSTVQLDKKLPAYIGHPVDIVRGADVQTRSGFRTTNYIVRGPQLADGSRRNFTLPRGTDKALAAGTDRPALGAGTTVNAEDMMA